ncbi:hypothetical protein AB0B30_13665 [Streptomyces narbonensis]|uniref:Uncharacterized protein n=1 Tax=Streptomyces narbonensis TaxID=67333 RepID=A0ABV3CIG2_9ACTN
MPTAGEGVPGPAGGAEPGTFWGRAGAETPGAAVGGAPAGVADPPSGPVVRAGAAARWTGAAAGVVVPPGTAAPAGASCRGGCTGRAETSGERRTGAGRTGPGREAPAVGAPGRVVAPVSPTGATVDGEVAGTGAPASPAARWTV